MNYTNRIAVPTASKLYRCIFSSQNRFNRRHHEEGTLQDEAVPRARNRYV
jgi:hypothetical protein